MDEHRIQIESQAWCAEFAQWAEVSIRKYLSEYHVDFGAALGANGGRSVQGAGRASFWRMTTSGPPTVTSCRRALEQR
jgi:hypothetical protein